MKNALSTMVPATRTLLKNREKPLPPSLLSSYIRSMLGKRDVLLASARQFRTPQYIFDDPALTRFLASFHRIFSQHLERFRIFYAVKSNALPALCRSVSDKGHGLDVSSGPELSLALSLGCTQIVFSGPGKTDQELALAVRNRERVTLLIDSAGELARVSNLVQESDTGNTPLKVGFRLTGRHHGVWGKFGIPPERLGALFAEALSVNGLAPQGIQFHTSWNLGPEAQVRMIESVGDCVRRIPRAIRDHLKFLDIGGGYWPERGEWLNPENTWKGRLAQLLNPEFRFKPGHFYRPAQPLDRFARQISRSLHGQGEPLSGIEVFMEPGRWISTPAMHVLLTVIDKKDDSVIIADGGINLLGWERPLSEFIPLINLTRPSLREFPVNVFGSLCTPLDIWGRSLFGDGVETGDVLLVPDQGAYTFSLRQSFIKPVGRVVRFDGASLSEIQPEQTF